MALPGLGIVFAQVSRQRDQFLYTQVHLTPVDRKKPFYYAGFAVLALLSIPIGGWVTLLLSFGYNIPTPGMYAMRLIPDPVPQTEWLALLIPRLIVAGFVNAACFYIVVCGLGYVLKRLFYSPW